MEMLKKNNGENVGTPFLPASINICLCARFPGET